MIRKIGRRPALALLVAVVAIASCAVAFGAGTARATSSDFSIYAVTSPGTNAPPATLGQFFMTPYGQDFSTEACVDFTNHVPSPLGAGPLYFSYYLEHVFVPDCWATWSHGYTGDAYWNNGNGNVTLQVPPGTRAFYLYVEPDAFVSEQVTVTAYGPTGFAQAGPLAVSGDAGAQYFGFYSPDGRITRIVVNDSTSGDFAVGEFGLNYQKLVRIS